MKRSKRKTVHIEDRIVEMEMKNGQIWMIKKREIRKAKKAQALDAISFAYCEHK